jgi:hypothetical protein
MLIHNNIYPKNRLLTIVALLTFSFIGCDDEKNQPQPVDSHYFIFGHFYGKCAGEGCVETYKLEDGRLYEDDLDHYPDFTTPIEAHWNELSNERYEAVKDIENDFPAALYGETEHVLGQPDAGDWGGIYVEVKYSGEMASKSGFWLLDKNEYNMSQVYNDFVDSIEVKIALIQ